MPSEKISVTAQCLNHYFDDMLDSISMKIEEDVAADDQVQIIPPIANNEKLSVIILPLRNVTIFLMDSFSTQ